MLNSGTRLYSRTPIEDRMPWLLRDGVRLNRDLVFHEPIKVTGALSAEMHRFPFRATPVPAMLFEAEAKPGEQRPPRAVIALDARSDEYAVLVAAAAVATDCVTHGVASCCVAGISNMSGQSRWTASIEHRSHRCLRRLRSCCAAGNCL